MKDSVIEISFKACNTTDVKGFSERCCKNPSNYPSVQLDFISDNMKDFNVLARELKLDHNRLIEKCLETALRASYDIFTRRDKPWTNPAFLCFN